MSDRGIIMTLSGSTCSGKTFFAESLDKGDAYQKVITHTTREPRTGEQDGVDYHFVSKSDFLDGLKAGHFAEFTELTSRNGETNFYGTSALELNGAMSAGKIPLIVCDPVGPQELSKFARDNDHHLLSVFVDCPIDIAENRLQGRLDSGEITQSDYDKRLGHLRDKESQWKEAFDYSLMLKVADPQQDLSEWKVELARSAVQLEPDVFKGNAVESRRNDVDDVGMASLSM